jgi:hypothetical protein
MFQIGFTTTMKFSEFFLSCYLFFSCGKRVSDFVLESGKSGVWGPPDRIKVSASDRAVRAPLSESRLSSGKKSLHRRLFPRRQP